MLRKMETYNSEELLLVMRQQQSRYAVPAKYVMEIITGQPITGMPAKPAFLKGILNYKGHIVPVLSLAALCGCGNGEAEQVSVVMDIGEDKMVTLTADSAESLISDNGQRMRYDETLMNGELIKLDRVIPGDPAILVLDMNSIYEAATDRVNSYIEG